jgi:GAF domain-containing protein
LRLLYDLSRRLATFNELDDILRHATGGLRELFDAEGSAVLIFEPRTHELRFPIASQREGSEATPAELAEVRFPADQGVAGWVLKHGKAVAVDDCANDPRFYRGVDHATGATTRTLFAAPMRTDGPSIGVIEVMNPGPGHSGPDDVEFLDAVASDIAVAYAKAELHDRLREEAATLRRLAQLVWALRSTATPPSEAAATGMSSDATNAVDPRVREAELNYRLLLDRDGRQFVPVAGSRWAS